MYGAKFCSFGWFGFGVRLFVNFAYIFFGCLVDWSDGVKGVVGYVLDFCLVLGSGYMIGFAG